MVSSDHARRGTGVLPPPAVLEALSREGERLRRVDAFWAAAGAELRREYPQQFVAVDDIETGNVVAADPDLLAFQRKLTALGLGPGDVEVRFIRTERLAAW